MVHISCVSSYPPLIQLSVSLSENWRAGNRGVLRADFGHFQELGIRVHPVLSLQRLKRGDGAYGSARSPAFIPCGRSAAWLNWGSGYIAASWSRTVPVLRARSAKKHLNVSHDNFSFVAVLMPVDSSLATNRAYIHLAYTEQCLHTNNPQPNYTFINHYCLKVCAFNSRLENCPNDNAKNLLG